LLLLAFVRAVFLGLCRLFPRETGKKKNQKGEMGNGGLFFFKRK